ncbi:MAG: transketolase [Actinomycetota bacterium]|nr:transketolase [Actinomycetota bacterium]
MKNLVEQRATDALRVLSIDAVQRANSGHPGMPMGMADIAAVLWSRFLVVDPDDPAWIDRDRFVLSNGHGSMLLYSLLHLSGFPLSMDDIKAFRQFGSATAGHPEHDPGLGIDMTTGPLGQGFATGIGMAIAEAHLRSVLGSDLIDHRTYGFVSDGDLMEGVTAEAASLAGHLGLGKITYLYDDNHITIDGTTDLAFTEDVAARFDSYGWHTITVDGHDREAIAEAIAAANEDARPSLVLCRTHIGFGSPNKQDTSAAHGSPLGDDEIALTRAAYGWDLPPFEIPAEVYDFYRDAMQRGGDARMAWTQRCDASDAGRKKQLEEYFGASHLHLGVPFHEAGSLVATRTLSGEVLQEAAGSLPGLIGGSGDLTPSNNSRIEASGDFTASDRTGRNVRFGIREHAMGSIVNGITLHGGLRGFGATFLTFSDYMRPAVRLGALMGTPSIWVWTHDSVFLGEDGPTHQPVEHLAALRSIPGLRVIRPADPTEVAVAWESAIDHVDGPTALILSRQGLAVPREPIDRDLVARGGYVRRRGDDAVLIATGSEVSLAEQAAELLADRGVSIRVVSMPCAEVFLLQEAEYRAEVVGRDLPVATVEAGVTFGWERFSGLTGLRIGIDRFGVSAPASVIAEEWGFTPQAVSNRLAAWLGVS